MQRAGVVVTEDNLPTTAWLNNYMDTNDGCTYCSEDLDFSDGNFGYQIDAKIPHARGGPGYTEANMAAAVSCFAFTFFMLLLTHSLLSFQCCTFCNRAKMDDTLEDFLAYTRRFRDYQLQHERRRLRRRQNRTIAARPYPLAADALAADRGVLVFFDVYMATLA
jgi:hypothetical protein